MLGIVPFHMLLGIVSVFEFSVITNSAFIVGIPVDSVNMVVFASTCFKSLVTVWAGVNHPAGNKSSDGDRMRCFSGGNAVWSEIKADVLDSCNWL